MAAQLTQETDAGATAPLLAAGRATGFLTTAFLATLGLATLGLAAVLLAAAAGLEATGLRWGRVRWLNTKAHSASLRLLGLLP